MNVVGMPWYMPRKQRSGDGGIRNSELGIDGCDQGNGSGAYTMPPVLTRREKLAFSFGVLKAALLVSLVFIGALLAFILFCTEIWFR